MLRALVTAGGTREPIDDVRFITNASRGRFPGAIANELQTRNIATTLLATSSLIKSRFDIHPDIEVVHFDSFVSLNRAIHEAIERHGPPNILFMAAAVSDFSPVPQSGKISSQSDHLTLHLKRNPKILAQLRETCGPDTFIAGFKLLSQATPAELIRVAVRQNVLNQLDLTVANDFAHLKSGTRHPILMVTPEGAAIPASGTRESVARTLVDLALTRHHATRPQHKPLPNSQALSLNLPSLGGATAFSIKDNTFEHPTIHFRTRQAAHAAPTRLTFENSLPTLSHPTPHPDAPTLAIEHAFLHHETPELHALLSLDLPIALVHDTLHAAFPNGTLEHAQDLHASAAQHLSLGMPQANGFLVGQAHSSQVFLGAMQPHVLPQLEKNWARAQQELQENVLADLTTQPDWRLTPILDGVQLVGVCVESGDRSWLSPYVLKKERCRGLGDRILHEVLEKAYANVALPADSDSITFLRQRAFREVSNPTHAIPKGLVLLESPLKRTELRRAASVCVYNPRRGCVMLGRRKRGAWPDYWSFPGGNIEPGESTLEAGVRELEEETGVRVNPRAAVREETVYVDSGPNRAYAVTNFVILTTRDHTIVETDELASEWVTLQEALKRRPMAAGTRRILRLLSSRPLDAVTRRRHKAPNSFRRH